MISKNFPGKAEDLTIRFEIIGVGIFAICDIAKDAVLTRDWRFEACNIELSPLILKSWWIISLLSNGLSKTYVIQSDFLSSRIHKLSINVYFIPTKKHLYIFHFDFEDFLNI